MPFTDRDTWVRRRRNWIGGAQKAWYWATHPRHLRLIAKLATAAGGVIVLALAGAGAWGVLVCFLLLMIAGEAIDQWRREA